MNIKSSYKYQMYDSIKAFIVFYATVLIVTILIGSLAVPMIQNNGNVVTHLNGMEITTIIFIFIVGLCSFKENFKMLTQNSVSRKSIFLGHKLTAISLAFGAAVIDKILSVIITLISKNIKQIDYSSLFALLYGQDNYLNSFLFSFLAYLAVISIGYTITILFYRMNKVGKILVGAGVPVLFFQVLPIVDGVFLNNTVLSSIFKFADFALGISTGKYSHSYITFIIVAIVCSALSWLLARKAKARE